MILFFKTPSQHVIAAEVDHSFSPEEISKLCWLFGEATPASESDLQGRFVGPRREMVTPWSTNAVEITQNMGLAGISRIEAFIPMKDGDEPDTGADYDPVDLKRLTEMLRHVPGCSERLLAAVGEATVCCRSNRGTVCGLSICHPCHEDESRSGERDDYGTRFGDLSPAYMRYLQRFGELFTGQAR